MRTMTKYHYIFMMERSGPLSETACAHRVSACLDANIESASPKIIGVYPFFKIDQMDFDMKQWRYRADPGKVVRTPTEVNPMKGHFNEAIGSGITFLSPETMMDFQPDYGCHGWYMAIIEL